MLDWSTPYLYQDSETLAAGKPKIKEELLNGYQAGDKHLKVHLDGHNLLPYLTGEVDESPRHGFFYQGTPCQVYSRCQLGPDLSLSASATKATRASVPGGQMPDIAGYIYGSR